MYELARNPEAQSKAYAEINEVLRRHDGKLTYESINEMKYMENCIDGEKFILWKPEVHFVHFNLQLLYFLSRDIANACAVSNDSKGMHQRL